MRYSCVVALVVPSLVAGLLSAPMSAAPAIEPWGTVKGRVVWANKELPQPKEITITRDKAQITACLNGAKWLEENWVLNKDNQGLRWVLVWLAPAKPTGPDAKPAPLPIHPDLKEIKNKEIVIEVACCRFEPHVLGVRQGQSLVVKNISKIPHNFNLNGPPDFASSNTLIEPDKEYKRDDLKPTSRPLPHIATCNIHPGMKAWIGVFDHPYFAVTDADGKFEIKNAPAGTWRVYLWHEETGWLNEGRREGQPITIKAEQTTDLGDVQAKEP